MNKFWTDKYLEGVAKDVPYTGQSLNDFFDEVLTKFAPRKFMTNMGVSRLCSEFFLTLRNTYISLHPLICKGCSDFTKTTPSRCIKVS